MALTPGTRLGPYDVTAQIGLGGMGEVYRATDTNLKRSVAIKVLPASVAADAERLARFQREAEVLGAFNHPNIAQIHGLEKSDGTIALVMELVEGPTLADRIAQGAIPIDEALPIAKQIADALEAAHEQGIIHRDLKPANIKVRSDGIVKVLDFGLAKAMEPASALRASAGQAPSQSATITTPAMTQAGMILGTAAYMSPEQARGRTVDKRSDIWAFGCVLFEMLTGNRAFPGEDITDTLAAVVRAEPEWSMVPRAISPTLLWFLRRSLQKDPKQRIPDIAAMRLALEGAFETSLAGDPGRGELAAVARWRRLASLAAVAFAAASISGLVAWNVSQGRPRDQAPSSAVTRFRIDGPQLTNQLPLALSPDGRQAAYVGEGASGLAIFVHRLDELDPRLVPGTEGVTVNSYPFWSPDSRSLAFMRGRDLKRVEVAGGRAAETVTSFSSSEFRRGAWGPDGTMLIATNVINRVPATGGQPVAITQLDPALGEIVHSAPWFLPDGRHFLYKTTTADSQNRAIYIGSLDPGVAPIRLLEASRAIYVRPGFIFFSRQRALYARPFDADLLTFTGEAIPIHDNIAYAETPDSSAFDVSDGGTLIFREDRPQLLATLLTWIDRAGSSTGLPLSVSAGSLRLSPDGSRIAFSDGVPASVWIFDVTRGVRTRLTTGGDTDHNPVWSHDGASVAFDSHRGDARAIYQKRADGATPEQLLFDGRGPGDVRVTDWSRDGRFIVFEQNRNVGAGSDIWVLPTFGDRQPFQYVGGSFTNRFAALSPDGRWMAYTTDESGASQVVVQPFPDRANGKWQVSARGGAAPRWARDGKELYYMDLAGSIVRVAITTDLAFGVGNATSVSPMVPDGEALFRTNQVMAAAVIDQWDVTDDGQRVLRTVTGLGASSRGTSAGGGSRITVVLNWRALVEKR